MLITEKDKKTRKKQKDLHFIEILTKKKDKKKLFENEGDSKC